MARACHKTCRGRKQLARLREAAHEGGTHREPNPYLVALPSAAYWSHLPGNRKTLEARHCSEVELHGFDSSLEALALRVCEGAVYPVTSEGRVEIHWPGDMEDPRLTGTTCRVWRV